jgi:hypothetical protein
MELNEMSSYKIQTKIGQAEFSAEGAEDSVRADYNLFLQALESRSADNGPGIEGDGFGSRGIESGGDVEAGLLQAVFKVDQEHGWVSLKVLPPAESANRAADAALLLIYGFHRLLEQSEAPVTKLISGLRESGISVDRFDRTIATHSNLVLKGGQKIGAKFRLNNQGMAQAASMIKRFFN